MKCARGNIKNRGGVGRGRSPAKEKREREREERERKDLKAERGKRPRTEPTRGAPETGRVRSQGQTGPEGGEQEAEPRGALGTCPGVAGGHSVPPSGAFPLPVTGIAAVEAAVLPHASRGSQLLLAGLPRGPRDLPLRTPGHRTDRGSYPKGPWVKFSRIQAVREPPCEKQDTLIFTKFRKAWSGKLNHPPRHPCPQSPTPHSQQNCREK